MDQPIENCLSLTGVEKLIQVPTGCAEQTMVKMAPAVYAIEYLDASEQWANFDPEKKDEAISMIEKGMQNQTNQPINQTGLLPFRIAHQLLLLAQGVNIALTQPHRNASDNLQTDKRNRTVVEDLDD